MSQWVVPGTEHPGNHRQHRHIRHRRPRFFAPGEAEVISKRSSDINGFLSAQKLHPFAKKDVSKALNLPPGVHLSAVGPRNCSS